VDTPASARRQDQFKPDPGLRFVARQPILTADEQVFGYELLFRDGIENYFRCNDSETASRSTLDSSLLLGLDVLCGKHYAFVNCTRDVLVNDHAFLLPPRQTVIEILETVRPDDMVVSACRRLKQAGYLIALDDFIANGPREPLTGIADIIKVDLRATTPEQQDAMVRRFGNRHRLLAEKVETREEFRAARSRSFLYFQGYFFRRPEVLMTRDIPRNLANYLCMLQEVSLPELDLRRIEKLVKSEVSLCYRLLRYLNSARFCFGTEIRSVRHALTILGEREIRRWVQLVATLGAGQTKSSELVLSALVRARFCELLAPEVAHGGSDLFLMGLMSLMDAILEIPMSEVLDKVPLDQAIKNVILGGPSHLRTIFRLMLAQESGEWPAAAELARLLHVSKDHVADAYWQAMDWARQVSGRG
jgi:EAL and modified HD-GYP domain-containing signal transduction protein